MSPAERLSRLDEEGLRRLLVLRPELRQARDLRSLEAYLTIPGITKQAVLDLPGAQRQLLEAACLLPPGARLADLALLDPAFDAEADGPGWQQVLEHLRERLLLDGEGDEIVVPAAVARAVEHPLGLGRALAACLEDWTLYAMQEVLSRYGQPPVRSREAARRALAGVFGDPGALMDLLGRLPADARTWLERADADGPVVKAPGVDPYRGLVPDDPALLLLLDHLLLVAVGQGRVELPLEVGLALRMPRAHTFQLTPPADARPPVADVAARAGEQVARLLDLTSALVARVDREPLPLLAAGGVGVKDVRALAKEAHAAPEDVVTTLALLARLGLVVEGRKDVRVTTRWVEWSALDDAARWSDLLRAWLSTSALPPPAPGSGRRLRAALVPSWERGPESVRAQLRDVLAEPGPDSRDWAAAWAWRFPPQRRTAQDPLSWVPDAELRADVLAEAALLGLLVQDAVTPLARVLTERADPAAVLAELGAAGVERVRAQADLTLVCTGRPSARLRADLDRLATVESSGAATVWRLSETSLAPAFDDGSTPEQVLAVLRECAGELPQAMEYLVGDAHRRHGRVVVGAARSYAVVADDASLQDVVRRRGAVGKRLAAAGVRRVAASVAVADVPAEDLMALLRDLGLAAVVDSASRAPVDDGPRVKRARPPALRPLVDLSEREPDVAALAAALRRR